MAHFIARATPSLYKYAPRCLSILSFGRLDAARHIRVRFNVRLHDLVEIGLVYHGASLGAFGLLLEVLAQEVKIELAFFNLGASLQTVPG